MADPEWQGRWAPVCSAAEELLANLTRGKLIAKLVEVSLLSLDEQESLTTHFSMETTTTTARKTIDILRLRPPPSFQTFCDVLLKVEHGCDLRELLLRTPAMAAVRPGSSWPAVGDRRICGMAIPAVEDASSVGRHPGPPTQDISHACLSSARKLSPSQNAGALDLSKLRMSTKRSHAATEDSFWRDSSTSTEPSEPEAKRHIPVKPVIDPVCGSSPAKEDCKKVDFYMLDNAKIYSAFKCHKLIVEDLIDELCQAVYEKKAEIKYKRLAELNKTFKLNSDSGSDPQVEIGKKVFFKIIFPDLEGPERFGVYFTDVQKRLAHVLGCEAKDVDILPTPGCCTLVITVAGQAFVNFLVSLTKPKSLAFLYTVEKTVKIGIGTFPPVPLSLFCEKYPEDQEEEKYDDIQGLSKTACKKYYEEKGIQPFSGHLAVPRKELGQQQSVNMIDRKLLCLAQEYRKKATRGSSPTADSLQSLLDECGGEKTQLKKRVKMVHFNFGNLECINYEESKDKLRRYSDNLQEQLREVKINLPEKRRLAKEWCENKKQVIFLSAAAKGRSDVCEIMIGREVSVDTRTANGFQALHLAAKNGKVNTCKLLMKLGARTDSKDEFDRQPLHLAASSGHSATCEILIKSGANLNEKDKDDQRPLHWAALNGHYVTCQILIKSGARVNEKDKYQCQPLHLAAANGHSVTCEILIKSGAQLNEEDDDSRQPLHLAALGSHSSTCEILLKSKAKVNEKDDDGRQPLHMAALEGHSATCKILVNNAARLNDKDKYERQPLHLAALRGHSATCEALVNVNSGAGLNDKDNEGRQPLHLAAESGHSDTCDILIKSGAHLRDLDNDGRQPLTLAKLKSHSAACQIITKALVYGSR
eukprot:m.149364 g.149364  ORF g.149364 m.149364 type:complete len:871 (+) comp38520_c1_seq5:44-2656(+)